MLIGWFDEPLFEWNISQHCNKHVIFLGVNKKIILAYLTKCCFLTELFSTRKIIEFRFLDAFHQKFSICRLINVIVAEWMQVL